MGKLNVSLWLSKMGVAQFPIISYRYFANHCWYQCDECLAPSLVSKIKQKKKNLHIEKAEKNNNFSAAVEFPGGQGPRATVVCNAERVEKMKKLNCNRNNNNTNKTTADIALTNAFAHSQLA